MKVLWITERFPPDRGGAAASAARQVAALAPHLSRLDVLRLTSELPPAHAEVAEHEGYRLVRVGRAAGADESLQVLLQSALNLLDVFGHDLVHGFYAVHAGYVATVAARLRGRRSVVSLRGNDVDRAMFHGPRLPFVQHAVRTADAVACVSKEMLRKAQVLSEREDGLVVVPNSVDGSIFHDGPAPADVLAAHRGAPRPWIGFSGELRLKKGLPLLMDLAERMEERHLGTLFWIGGVRAEECRAAESWLRASRGGRRVRQVAYLEDAKRLGGLYRAMDLMAFPSLWEGMPNALLEAMACGRPVLATAVGGCHDVVRDGVDGYLIPPSRLSEFASEALAIAARDAAELERVGRAARNRVLTDFTPAAERDAILQLYEAVTR